MSLINTAFRGLQTFHSVTSGIVRTMSNVVVLPTSPSTESRGEATSSSSSEAEVWFDSTTDVQSSPLTIDTDLREQDMEDTQSSSSSSAAVTASLNQMAPQLEGCRHLPPLPRPRQWQPTGFPCPGSSPSPSPSSLLAGQLAVGRPEVCAEQSGDEVASTGSSFPQVRPSAPPLEDLASVELSRQADSSSLRVQPSAPPADDSNTPGINRDIPFMRPLHAGESNTLRVRPRTRAADSNTPHARPAADSNAHHMRPPAATDSNRHRERPPLTADSFLNVSENPRSASRRLSDSTLPDSSRRYTPFMRPLHANESNTLRVRPRTSADDSNTPPARPASDDSNAHCMRPPAATDSNRRRERPPLTADSFLNVSENLRSASRRLSDSALPDSSTRDWSGSALISPTSRRQSVSPERPSHSRSQSPASQTPDALTLYLDERRPDTHASHRQARRARSHTSSQRENAAAVPTLIVTDNSAAESTPTQHTASGTSPPTRGTRPVSLQASATRSRNSLSDQPALSSLHVPRTRRTHSAPAAPPSGPPPSYEDEAFLPSYEVATMMQEIRYKPDNTQPPPTYESTWS